MKEQDLIDLGFEKEFGYDNGEEFYYYVYYFGRGLSLISSANDEPVDSKWFVDVFEEDNIRFTTKEDLTEFINIINRNKR
jgi:hypothetical protein